MLNVSVIGIGNAGNQIALLAKKQHDIDGYALNSSANDLKSIQDERSIPALIIGDDKGSGKNRNEAKSFLKKTIKEVLVQPDFIKFIKDRDVVFMVSSLGGGTGSGMTPIMTDILSRKFPDTKFIVVGVLPQVREALASQDNSIEYLKEIDAMDDITYMLYDNDKLNVNSSAQIFEAVNKEIVDSIATIKGLNQLDTTLSSIDEKDMMRIISTPGRLAVYQVRKISEKQLDSNTIEDLIVDKIKTGSNNVDLDRNRSIKRLGIISNLNSKLDTMWDPNLPSIKELIGEWVEGFEHISISQSENVENNMFILCSGMSMPDDRIEDINNRISSAMDKLNTKIKSSSLNGVDKDVLKKLRDDKNQSPMTSSVDLDDIFDKY